MCGNCLASKPGEPVGNGGGGHLQVAGNVATTGTAFEHPQHRTVIDRAFGVIVDAESLRGESGVAESADESLNESESDGEIGTCEAVP